MERKIRGLLQSNSPREEIKEKSEKKRYFLTKMIKIRPEGTHFLFTLLFSFFSKGVLQLFATRPCHRRKVRMSFSESLV